MSRVSLLFCLVVLVGCSRPTVTPEPEPPPAAEQAKPEPPPSRDQKMIEFLGQFSPDEETIDAVARANPLDPSRPSPPQCPTETDPYGDPLPAGAITRLTTGRAFNGGPIHYIAYSPDGRRVLTGHCPGSVRIWDAATGKQVRRFREDLGLLQAVVFSPDSRLLATVVGDYGQGQFQGAIRIQLWDVATGQQVRDFGAGTLPRCLAFSPDGRVLASGGNDRQVHLWEVSSGRHLNEHDTEHPVAVLAFTPDGRGLLTGGQSTPFCLWDTNSFKQLASFPWTEHGRTSLALSSDGSRVAVAHALNVHLRDLKKGRFRRTLPGRQRMGQAVAFSPDGRTLATVALTGVQLWEVASGEHCGQMDAADVTCVAFSPDGRRLASGSTNGKGLVWDVTGRCRKGRFTPGAVTANQLRNLEADLAGGDATAAFRAVWALVAAAPQSVPYLQERLQLSDPPDRQRVLRLIADLDSAKFSVRQRAAEQLEAVGAIAEPELRQVLKGKPSLEVRRRVERLLELLDEDRVPAEQLFGLRALEVLEQVGNPESRRLLRQLARGAPEARLTQEARASLKRLGARPTAREHGAKD